jgi:hypothetical protein
MLGYGLPMAYPASNRLSNLEGVDVWDRVILVSLLIRIQRTWGIQSREYSFPPFQWIFKKRVSWMF